MSFESQSFNLSGPSHLTTINWGSPYYRSSVMASLVNGVYVLEHDRQENRLGNQKGLASPWWEFFNFQLHNVIVDPADSSFFGAVFELKVPPLYSKICGCF
ncbi:GDSL esterase/lipase [Quillaja saponaria]|uniref:GDSL esterase/lipase n=1 Tax=Quillaja saponaria TaxID=32244 RepID=A0AAD7PSD9_QUISA|nr:GDSL esterase/lipase [Quillaja saponaria]